ncbi:Mitochondrial porin [Cystobasidiomycetes sp. EMM_F5]
MTSSINLKPFVAPIPPSYKDFGKPITDLLGKDYPLGVSLLEVKTRAPNGVNFTAKIAQDTVKDVILGDLEGKYVDGKNGITVTQTWLTNNSLKTLVELDGQIAKGLKVEALGQLNPDKNTKSALVTATYRQPAFHGRLITDVFNGPAVTADAVVGQDGFLVGVESKFDAQKQVLKSYAAGLGYSAPEYSVTLKALDALSTFQAGYYHRVNRDTEAGALATYSTKKQGAVGLEVGAKTYLDAAAFVKAKINNTGLITFGYTQALRPGVKFTGGLQLDTLKFSGKDAAEKPAVADVAKVGVSFVFEA